MAISALQSSKRDNRRYCRCGRRGEKAGHWEIRFRYGVFSWSAVIRVEYLKITSKHLNGEKEIKQVRSPFFRRGLGGFLIPILPGAGVDIVVKAWL